jgi:hypothetical protein
MQPSTGSAGQPAGAHTDDLARSGVACSAKRMLAMARLLPQES